jgi:FlaA1/EpsC-like NDP-sugar epimerase
VFSSSRLFSAPLSSLIWCSLIVSSFIVCDNIGEVTLWNTPCHKLKSFGAYHQVLHFRHRFKAYRLFWRYGVFYNVTSHMILSYSLLHSALLYYVILYSITFSYFISCYIILYYIIACCIWLYFVISCHIIPCYALWRDMMRCPLLVFSFLLFLFPFVSPVACVLVFLCVPSLWILLYSG